MPSKFKDLVISKKGTLGQTRVEEIKVVDVSLGKTVGLLIDQNLNVIQIGTFNSKSKVEQTI